MESQKVNIATLVDNSRLGLFQWTTFVLCGLCLIMDGFDVQAMGYVAPAVIKEFKIPGAEMGLVFSAALMGVLLGCLGAWATRQAMQSILFEVTSLHLPVVAAVIILMTLVTLLASLLPAIRAARVSPTEAMKNE